MTSITIPLSVTHIGDYAFSGCSALKSIVSKITEPFDIIDNVFENLYTKAQLTVPQGCIDKYKKAKGWRNFKYIAEGPEGIRLITVKQNSDAIWYNLQGRKVSTPEKGISIIRYKDGTTKKVMK